MPAGQWMTREVRSSEPPEELRRAVLLMLTCRLNRAGFRLVESGEQTILYRRRYFPAGAPLLGLLLAAVAAWASASTIHAGYQPVWSMLVVGAAGFAMAVSARRSEMLAVTVLARAGGSAAMVAGYANELALIVIQDWSPPWPPELTPLPTSDFARSRRHGIVADHGLPTYEGA
jgi:hypothetical protein